MQQVSYKLLALDLDGTLTNSKKKISLLNKEYIAKAQDLGVQIILASGRPVLGIRPVAEELGLYQRGGYILAYNGGQVIDCSSGEDLLKETVAMEYNHSICTVDALFDVYPLAYNNYGVLCKNDSSVYVKKEAFNNSVPVIKVENLEHAITHPVVKFMVVGEPEELQKAYKYLKSIYNGKLNIFFSEPYFMEITPSGIEKAASLKKLLAILSVNRQHLMVCGDGLNDIAMLDFAGFAVAMGNAYEEAKKHADYIAASNEENGVAEAIRKFICNESADYQ